MVVLMYESPGNDTSDEALIDEKLTHLNRKTNR